MVLGIVERRSASPVLDESAQFSVGKLRPADGIDITNLAVFAVVRHLAPEQHQRTPDGFLVSRGNVFGYVVMVFYRRNHIAVGVIWFVSHGVFIRPPLYRSMWLRPIGGRNHSLVGRNRLRSRLRLHAHHSRTSALILLRRFCRHHLDITVAVQSS